MGRMNDEVQAELGRIVERFGIDAVRNALKKHAECERPRGRRGRAARKPGRARITAVEYVQKMGLPEERAAVMARAAAEFERRAFLPTLGDIRSFCETYGIDAPKSTSRTAGIPRVFRFLESMDTADIETMLDERLFSGPVELGPIAEAIRGRARQNREVLAVEASENVAAGQEDGFDTGGQTEGWDVAKADRAGSRSLPHQDRHAPGSRLSPRARARPQ